VLKANLWLRILSNLKNSGLWTSTSLSCSTVANIASTPDSSRDIPLSSKTIKAGITETDDNGECELYHVDGKADEFEMLLKVLHDGVLYVNISSY